MASNKEKQMVKKDEENLEKENISKTDSIKTENKLRVFSEDNVSTHKEEIDNGFACLCFCSSMFVYTFAFHKTDTRYSLSGAS